jgi:hypothetical protein
VAALYRILGQPLRAAEREGEHVNRADEDFLERIAGAEAPFWRHVRDAILARREERVA